jgi:rhamnopyranosyl-N-acetylglucosaminyl-diphospho-decaprenol beta-1,3/1,4-galactofuranosyltransferase
VSDPLTPTLSPVGERARVAPVLAAVVVTYNRLAQLQITIGRLLAEPVDHLVVVDNGSTDGSREWLWSLDDKRLTLIEPKENGGGAMGFEIGMKAAVDRFDPDWLVIMDDDARPRAGTLARFKAAVPEADAVAGAVYYPGGGLVEMNRPWVNPFASVRAFWKALTGGRGGFHVPDGAYDPAAGPMAIDGASFVGLFLSRRAVELAGYPDGRLFIYGDDVLYTLSLAKKGGRALFDPALVFDHDCAQAAPGEIWRPLWKTYYLHRNRWFVYRLAAGPVLFWPLMALMVPKWFWNAQRLQGEERLIYRRLLKLALSDARRGQRHRPHAQILALAAG